VVDYMNRAYAAYYKAGDQDHPGDMSGVQEHDGKEYVVLRNINGVLAVYRITRSGQLKRLKRWPKELKEY